MNIKIGDSIPTDDNGFGVVVEIDIHTLAPDKLVKINIGQNVYVWVKMSDLDA